MRFPFRNLPTHPRVMACVWWLLEIERWLLQIVWWLLEIAKRTARAAQAPCRWCRQGAEQYELQSELRYELQEEEEVGEGALREDDEVVGEDACPAAHEGIAFTPLPSDAASAAFTPSSSTV
jgi:hypothetical protein